MMPLYTKKSWTHWDNHLISFFRYPRKGVSLTNDIERTDFLIQLKFPYAEYYYLTEDGKIFNSATQRYISPDLNHCFRLRTQQKAYKKIALRTLYFEYYHKYFFTDNIPDLPGELWKEIPDTNGLYLVSNRGRIKSYRGYEAIILKPFFNKSGGYLRVELVIDKIRRCVLVHKMVASCWLPMPDRMDYQIHHKDFNKNNNDVDNLEYVSPIEHLKLHNTHRKEIQNNGNP